MRRLLSHLDPSNEHVEQASLSSRDCPSREDILDKRARQNQGSSIESTTKTLIWGIKDANLYGTLNKPNFTITDIITTATYTIDRNSLRGTGGIYIRSHTSSSAVTRWQPNTEYVYIGKTVDLRDRFDGHSSSKTSYGDLTRISGQLLSSALYFMSETDTIDFRYLVEQIFLCLFDPYRQDLHVDLDDLHDCTGGIEHVEAVEAALYFREVSEKVFSETHYLGAINRSSFGVSHGTNYSMPFKQWALPLEQMLFTRCNTLIRSKTTGATVPMSIFWRAEKKTTSYTAKRDGSYEMCAFQKYQSGRPFWAVRHTQKTLDGSMGARQDDPYQLVFEVRTDGQAHSDAWSRLPTIGPYHNWGEGASLAVRMEWEYPPNSGKWRHRYLYANKVYTFADKHKPGSHVSYIKIITMVRWLFNAEPNKPQSWMPLLRGCAYVLQTDYNYHNQTIEIKPQTPLAIRSGEIKSKASIVAAMNAVGLENVDGPFGQQDMCDGCAMLDNKVRVHMHSD